MYIRESKTGRVLSAYGAKIATGIVNEFVNSCDYCMVNVPRSLVLQPEKRPFELPACIRGDNIKTDLSVKRYESTR
jgi:hypothetical protein